jgi:outer membrane protein
MLERIVVARPTAHWIHIGLLSALTALGCVSADRYLLLSGEPQAALHRLDRIEALAPKGSRDRNIEQRSALAWGDIELHDERPQLAVSVARARADALSYNPSLAAERVRVWVARSRLEEEVAKFDPVIRAAMAVYRQSELPASPPLAPFEGSVNVALPLVTGGEVSAEVFSGRQNSPLSPPFGPGVSVTLEHPLLLGAGVRAAEYSLRTAGLHALGTAADVKTRVADVLRRVDRAYWSLYAAQGRRRVRWSQYGLALEHLEDARDRVSIGAVAGVEIVRAEAGMASRRDDVIVANAQVEQAELALKEIMSRPDVAVDSSLALALTTQPDPAAIEFDGSSLYRLATASRAELVRAHAAADLAAAELAIRRDGLWPRFDLIANYSYVPENLSNGLPGDDHRAFVGLRVEAPLGQRAPRARERYASLSRQQRELETNAAELQIRRELADARLDLDVTWKRIGVTSQDSRFARRNYDAERLQFELGTNTTTDVLIAARELGNAEIRAIEAQASYEIAKVSLAFATGMALGETKSWRGVRSDTRSDSGSGR